MQRGLFVLFNIFLVASFYVHIAWIGQHGPDPAEAARAREFLHNYWRDAFPPDAWYDWPMWLLQVFTGNMLAYPIGAKNGGSILTCVLVVLGSIALIRGRRWSLLALCWLPFALNLLAAILGKYPFGGSARITQHLAPFICVLMAHGIFYLLETVRSPAGRLRLHLACIVSLLLCGLSGIGIDLVKPYKTEHDRDVRGMARALTAQVGGEPIVLCHESVKTVLPEYQWYLRTGPFSLRWLHDEPPPQAHWLVLCGHQEPSVAEVVSSIEARAEGWRVTATDVRLAPPENAKMATMYCRWVRLVRTEP